MSTPTIKSRARTEVAARTQRADRDELAIGAGSPDWSDRPHHKGRPRLTSLLLLLGILAACALVAVYQINNRLAARDEVKVRQVVLTADPIEIESAASGNLLSLAVAKGDRVTAGQTLAVVEYTSKPGTDDDAVQVEIKAPTNGIVASVMPVNSVSLLGGQQLMTMYDPATKYFRVPMTYRNAAKIDIGASAEFDIPGFGNVEGTVVRVEEDFGDAGRDDEERLAQVVVQPLDPTVVANMPPGLIANGTVERNASDPNAVKLLGGSAD